MTLQARHAIAAVGSAVGMAQPRGEALVLAEQQLRAAFDRDPDEAEA